MVPAYIWGIPSGAVLDNHFRFVMPFYDEISHGNLVPGWLAESNNGFGDARFRFYPPVLYYVLSLFRWLTSDRYFATLSVFTLFSITGASGVYFWARQSLSRYTAVLAAFLFAIVPYHLVWRGRIRQKQFRPIHLPFVLTFAGTLFLTGYDLVIDSDYSSRVTFSHRIEEIRGARSFNDWLPPGASESKDLVALAGQIDTGNRQLIVSN
ncbi:MAG: glycosyltransferase family 39 protein [Pyrinomonadaceae bacterium]